MRNISIMILQRCLVFCAVLLFCGRTGAVELLGSTDPEIKKNFNQLLTTNACRGCNLRGAVLNRLNLADADLEGADLSGAQLNGACLVRANLHNAVLRGAWLVKADLAKVNLLGADIAGTTFTVDSNKNQGSQAAASAQNAVNQALADLFATQQKEEQPPQVHQTTGTAPADGQKRAATPQIDAALSPEEIPVFFAPIEPAAEDAPAVKPQARRNVDDIPVIHTETTSEKKADDPLRFWKLLFEMKEKKQDKAAVAPGQSQQKTASLPDQARPAAPVQQNRAAQAGKTCVHQPAGAAYAPLAPKN